MLFKISNTLFHWREAQNSLASSFLCVIHQYLASEFGHEQDIPHSLNSFQEHLSLRLWNWPEVVLKVVTSKPVCLFSFTFSLPSSWEGYYWEANCICLLVVSVGGLGVRAQKHVTIGEKRWWQVNREASRQTRGAAARQLNSSYVEKPWNCLVLCFICVNLNLRKNL